MKYSVLGFCQEEVCKLRRTELTKKGKEISVRIDISDLAILKVIGDMSNRTSIKKVTINDKIYSWITYDKILQDLPILDIKKQALAERIDKLQSFGLVEKITEKTKGVGTFTYIRTGKEYENLLYKEKQENSQKHTDDNKNIPVCSQTYTGSIKIQTKDNIKIEYNDTKKEKEKEELYSSKKKNEENQNEVEKTWRNDFDTYRQIVEDAKAKLKSDSYFREKMEEIHINIDYDRTLENSVVVFWGTEEGWKKKCGTRGNNIDMASTLKKCFDKNIVYKPRTYNATKNSTYSIASEQRVIRQETDKRNIREDGTRFENGYIVYRSTKGLDEYIDGKPENIPMRPDDRHDWYSVYKVWAIFNEDGTFNVKGKRYYVSSKDYRPHEIPVNAPYRESEYTEYNPTTNSWEL